jgi:hypothetical protein
MTEKRLQRNYHLIFLFQGMLTLPFELRLSKCYIPLPLLGILATIAYTRYTTWMSLPRESCALAQSSIDHSRLRLVELFLRLSLPCINLHSGKVPVKSPHSM